MNNYYEVLGVSVNASDNVIKAAYRTLMKENHPDLASNESDRLRRENTCKFLGIALDTLTDPQKREKHNNDIKDNGTKTHHKNSCLNCRFELPSHGRFCRKCGTRVRN